MTSNVKNYSQNIDTNFPVQGQDNPSQGFRDNFAQIKLALDTTAQEITNLQSGQIIPVGVSIATELVAGIVKIGSGISVQPDGTISADAASYILSPATNTRLGGIKVGTGLTVSEDGTVAVIGGGGGGTYTLTTATRTTLGGVKIGNGINVSSDGTISVSTGTGGGGTSTYVLTTASATTLGGVKIGPGIGITADGTISASTATYSLPPATTITLGGVKVGTGISVDVDGTISVIGGGSGFNGGTITNPLIQQNLTDSSSTSSGAIIVYGGVGIGGNLNSGRHGIIYRGGTFGLPDNYDPGITINNSATDITGITMITSSAKRTFLASASGTFYISYGTSNVSPITSASTILKAQSTGEVYIKGKIYSGGYEVSTATLIAATTTTLGGVKIGSGVNVAADGTISVPPGSYVLTTATAATLGGIRLGSGLSATGNGTVNVDFPASYVLPAATQSTLGGVIVGTGLNVDAGTISLNTATLVNTATYATYISSTATGARLGGVRIGSGISITADGMISVSGSAGGQATRTVLSTTINNMAPFSSASATIVGFKGYAIYSIYNSAPAVTTVYISTATLRSDYSRSPSSAPGVNSGVIAQAITTASGTVYFTPAAIGFSAEPVPSTNIPIKVYNSSSNTVSITVQITALQMEG